MFLFVAMSGNPFFSFTSDFSKFIFILIVLLLVVMHNRYFTFQEGLIYYIFLIFYASIFIFQNLVLGFVSFPSTVVFLARITLGYIVIRYIGVNFKLAYFHVIFFVSFISLFGYIWNFLGQDIYAIHYTEQTNLYNDNSGRNIIFFQQKGDGSRNSGMFWEAGAFACYICLAFLFYLGSIKMLFKKHLFKVVVILLALITTYSTTGYIVLFILGVSTIYIEYSQKYGPFVLPVLVSFVIIAYITYENTDFLKDKIDHQFQNASARDEGEFGPDRLSALYFDIHYITKHPLIGNGFHSQTRYADHPELQKVALGHGNGFSDFLASMGILSLMFYSFYILKYNITHPVIFLVGILILLQGEPLLNYPLFLSLPFIFIYDIYNRHIIDLSQ